MQASNIVSALLEGKPRTKPRGQSAEPLIRAWIDSCEEDEAALRKMKPRLVRAACICARAVLHRVPEEHKQVCVDAIEAAEAWIAEPSEENRMRANEAGDAAWAAGAAWAAWVARAVGYAAGAAGADGYARAAWTAHYAHVADPTINFPAQIAAGLAEYPAFEGLE